MPSIVSVGLAKKLGLPDFGSLGANCNLQIEVDHDLLNNDPDGFRELARKAYRACSQAVHEELARQRDHQVGSSTATVTDADNHAAHSAPTNGSGRPMTEKQLKFARQLAMQIKGLGAGKLSALAHQLHGKPLEELTSFEASGLIDTLKEIKVGNVPLLELAHEVAP